MALRIRRAELPDLDALNPIYLDAMRELHRQGVNQWDENYPVGHLPEDIENGDLFVLTEGERVIGAFALNGRMDDWHAGLRWRGGEKAMYLHRLVVAMSERGKGYAGQAMLWVHDYAREQGCGWMRLDTNTANLSAMGLYHALGYGDVGLLHDFPDFMAMDFCLSEPSD